LDIPPERLDDPDEAGRAVRRRGRGKEGDELKLLAILRPVDGVDVQTEVARHAVAELRTLWGLYRESFVREMYSPSGPGAILVLEAESAEDAKQRVSEFPLVADSVMTAEILELKPFGAIEMLFSTTSPS
jgi:hypothetical protein